jgi:hypothetical protein
VAILLSARDLDSSEHHPFVHSVAVQPKVGPRRDARAFTGSGCEGVAMKPKKTARIVCANENEFWTTQKQFWQWVREGLVDVTGQNPLTGRFAGKREKLLVMVRHVILDKGSPNHKQEVLDTYTRLKPHVSKRRTED